MTAPTLEQLLAALAALQATFLAEQDALAAQQAAQARREEAAEAFVNLLAAFRGGVTSADVASMTAQLQAHARKLEQIAQAP